MALLRKTILATVLMLTPTAPVASAVKLAEPLHFFEGTTEGVSTVKVLMKKPYRARTIGRGRLDQKGSLVLIQFVEDEGRPTFERRWHIRRIAPGRFSGTMTQAIGPVTVTQLGERYLFRFKMKGSLSVEQWLTPLPDGKSARSVSTIKKLGIMVATSEGIIRKLA